MWRNYLLRWIWKMFWMRHLWSLWLPGYMDSYTNNLSTRVLFAETSLLATTCTSCECLEVRLSFSFHCLGFLTLRGWMSHMCDMQLLVMGTVVKNTWHTISVIKYECHTCERSSISIRCSLRYFTSCLQSYWQYNSTWQMALYTSYSHVNKHGKT